MSILGNLARRSIENPALPLTSTALAEWLSGPPSAAGVAVGEKGAFGLTAWYRAVALMAGTIAGLPLHLYKNGTRERVTQRTVLQQPNLAQTPFEFWQTMVANACAWGNAYGQLERDAAGVVREVWPLHPSTVHVESVKRSEQVPDGKAFYLDGESEGRTSRDVMHLPYLSPKGVVGLSPLQVAREALGIGIAAERSAGSFFASGSRLSGVLSSKAKLKQEEAERLQARWQQRTGGSSNAGKVVVLDNDTTFLPISIPPADAELLATRKFTATEIARLFGIPPHLLGDVEVSSSWGTGIEQQVLGFVKFTLGPWLQMIEQRTTRDLLPGGWTSGIWYAEYAVEGLLRGDSTARAAFYKSAINDGWMNRNEVRGLENREPVEGLDEYLAPANMTLITPDGQAIPLSGKGGTAAAPTAAEEARAIAEVMQKVYLAVGVVITPEEARAIANRGGADLDPVLPEGLAPAPPSPAGGSDAGIPGA